MRIRKIMHILMALVLLLGLSQEVIANGGKSGRHHRTFIHKRYHDNYFYHYPRRKFYIFKGYYYYYPRRYYPTYDYQAYRQNQNYLPLTVIADMASRGVPDDVIIEEIKRTGSNYQINSEVIAYLKDNRVSDKVINYMLGGARKSGY